MDRNLLLLFDRPREPIYIPKGDDQVNFAVGANSLPEKYQSEAQAILSRFNDTASKTVCIKQVPIPDLSQILILGRQENFSLFIPSHRRMATQLIGYFLEVKAVDDLLSLAAHCRDRINPHLFIYSLAVAMVHRPDTKHLSTPSPAEVFPDRFISGSIIANATVEANILPTGSRQPIEIPLNFTATDVDPEHRVAYWREDIGINLHHWHWHLVYPHSGPKSVVNKDRRGELFYYMHHQIIARYNTERYCNNLPHAIRLTNLREPIPEAYFPKLDQTLAGRSWPARSVNAVLSDIKRDSDQLKFKIEDVERFRDRILEAIHSRTVVASDGSSIYLDDVKGIDIIGNMVESSILTPNATYYGDIHNMIHVAISLCHDPDNRYLESFSVMGDTATAMRDPIFYRWHGYIDSMFTLFKDSLTPYTEQELSFPGITVQDIRINTPNANPNTLNTYWSKSDIELSRGLDFTPRGSVLARVQHLNHDQFSYNISIINRTKAKIISTVRIFLAPKFDEAGRTLSVNAQRLLMIEMDKFAVKLTEGENIITRNSVDSTLTIPFEATFRNLNDGRPGSDDLPGLNKFNFCGCGWPQHMLVPKGTKQGYPMDLFVMVTEYRRDVVVQADPTGCRTGVSFCGLRDLKYPDVRGMGFPFDRVMRQNVQTLGDFILPNMKLQQVVVRFNNVIKPRQTSNSRSIQVKGY